MNLIWRGTLGRVQARNTPPRAVVNAQPDSTVEGLGPGPYTAKDPGDTGEKVQRGLLEPMETPGEEVPPRGVET